ncbi:hypothetical protein HK405_007038 [Cladochytrium tenue]|nr:hypothetical protein HK405_007038 [Cladochytrium tenue]
MEVVSTVARGVNSEATVICADDIVHDPAEAGPSELGLTLLIIACVPLAAGLAILGTLPVTNVFVTPNTASIVVAVVLFILLYRMSYRVVRYATIAMISVFINEKKLATRFSKRTKAAEEKYNSVMRDGLKQRVVIAYPFMTSGRDRDTSTGVLPEVDMLLNSMSTTARNILYANTSPQDATPANFGLQAGRPGTFMLSNTQNPRFFIGDVDADSISVADSTETESVVDDTGSTLGSTVADPAAEGLRRSISVVAAGSPRLVDQPKLKRSQSTRLPKSGPSGSGIVDIQRPVSSRASNSDRLRVESIAGYNVARKPSQQRSAGSIRSTSGASSQILQWSSSKTSLLVRSFSKAEIADGIGSKLKSKMQARPSTNGLLHMVVVSQTGSDTVEKVMAQLDELAAWNELRSRFSTTTNGDGILMGYVHINPEQHIGWKWGALGDFISYLYTGITKATNYGDVITSNGKYRRQLGAENFKGDPLVARLASGNVDWLINIPDVAAVTLSGKELTMDERAKLYDHCKKSLGLTNARRILATAEEFDAYLKGLLMLPSPTLRNYPTEKDVAVITIDDKDWINSGSFWEWAAQMACMPSWVEGSVPSLSFLNRKASALTRFGSRAESLYMPISNTLLWLSDRQQTAGKSWFQASAYVRKVHETELLSAYIHTSHDQLESKAMNMVRLPSVICSDSRPETSLEMLDQLQRFLYGDLMVIASSFWDNFWPVRIARFIMSKPQGKYAANSFAEYMILENSRDFAFADVDFFLYLCMMCWVVPFLKKYLETSTWIPGSVPFAVAMTLIIGVPLVVNSVVNRVSWNVPVRSTIRILGRVIMIFVESALFVMPLLVIKPIMVARALLFFRFPEIIHGVPTGWSKKAPGYWADVLTALVGASFIFVGVDYSNPYGSFMSFYKLALAATICLPMILWPILTRPFILIKRDRQARQGEFETGMV